jgi:hypothetical protein
MVYTPFGRTKFFDASSVKDALSYYPILTKYCWCVVLSLLCVVFPNHPNFFFRVKGLECSAGSPLSKNRYPASRRADRIYKGTIQSCRIPHIIGVWPLDSLPQSSDTHYARLQPSTHDNPPLNQVTSATAKSSHVATNSIMVNRKPGETVGFQ